MFDWEDLRHFAALARMKTLTAAARSMHVEHATVARRVANLERDMGAKLIDRRGKRILLTSEGQRIAAMAERMEEEAATIERATLSAAPRLAGEVRISAPPALASTMLAEPLVRLRQKHRDINVIVVGEKRYVSLNRREADIAVRLNRPEEGDFSLSHIGVIAFRFYAAPAYLADTPEEAWSFISYDDGMAESPQHRLLLEVANGRAIGLRASTLEFQLAAARAGGGIAILPDFLVAGQPGLVEVPVGREPLIRGIWLVVHSDIRNVPIIRAVIQALKGE